MNQDELYEIVRRSYEEDRGDSALALWQLELGLKLTRGVHRLYTHGPGFLRRPLLALTGWLIDHSSIMNAGSQVWLVLDNLTRSMSGRQDKTVRLIALHHRERELVTLDIPLLDYEHADYPVLAFAKSRVPQWIADVTGSDDFVQITQIIIDLQQRVAGGQRMFFIGMSEGGHDDLSGQERTGAQVPGLEATDD